MATSTRNREHSLTAAALAAAAACLVLACAMRGEASIGQHRWWAGLGPVLPHDTFPADCGLCHAAGADWQELTEDFRFDHEAETGVALEGAHRQAQCLRCHNDRGPVAAFAARGCAGCHEDVHLGELGQACTECHQQQTWQPVAMLERHDRTRFPLEGVHVATACHRCHPGALLGNFVPVDPNCLSCHRDDLANAQVPDHIALGYVDRCDRCHQPTNWNRAEVNL